MGRPTSQILGDRSLKSPLVGSVFGKISFNTISDQNHTYEN